MPTDSQSPASNRPKSNVWAFFTKKGERKVACRLCGKDYAYHGGTSNLRDHLTRCHSKEFSQANPSHQPTIQSFLPRSTCKCSTGRAKEITSHIVDFIARDLRPMATVEGKGFLNLMKCVEPGYKVPSVTRISELVKKKYVAAKNRLKDVLKNVSSLAITTDIWTSCANEAYISVVGHFIDDNWLMVSCVLGTCPFPGNHTAVNILAKLQQVMDEYEFDMECVKAVVHDQASNMEVTGRILESDWGTETLNCAAHRLQLCINEGRTYSENNCSC